MFQISFRVSYSNFDTAFLRRKKIMDGYKALRLADKVLHSLCSSDSWMFLKCEI